MDSSLEQTLSKLLIPDNSVIIQATAEIKEALKKPDVCDSLLNIACASLNPHVRQYAIVLLRQKFSSKKNWQMFPDAFRENVKQIIIQRLVTENEAFVRNALADLGGTIARYELCAGTWPQMMAFIMENLKSADPQAREFGAMMLSVIVNSASFHLPPHISSLLNIFPHILKETENKNVLSYSIKTLTSLISHLDKKDVNLLQSLMPQVFLVIKELARTDPDSGYQLMEFFDELIEAELPIVIPFVKQLVQLFFEFITSSEYQQNIKIKTLHLIGLLTENKSKSLVKQKLIEPLLKVIFPIMSVPSDNAVEQMDIADPAEIDDEDISKVASQVLDMMALNLPPEKLIPPLLTLLEPALRSEVPYQRKAGYMAIGVVVEGCSEHIRNKYLSQMMQCIYKGISDTSPLVKKAAFFALGQFAEHIQSDINKYAAEFLPPLVDYVVGSCHNIQDNCRQITEVQRIFHQFEMFCESAEPVLTPYLPCIMEQVLSLYTTGSSNKIKILTLNALASVALAAKKEIMPYLQQIVAVIKLHLTGNQDEESRALEIQAIECLSTLITVMEPNSLTELCRDCMIYSTSMLNLTDDPDLKRRIYGLFGSLATMIKEDIGQYLHLILPHIIRSLKMSYLEQEKHCNLSGTLLPLFEDCSALENMGETDDSDTDSDDFAWYTVKNAYLEEKLDACKAIQDIAFNAPQTFFPFFHDCAEDVYEMMNIREDDVRIVAIKTNTQLCFVLAHNFERLERKEDLIEFLGKIIPELLSIADHDVNKDVVIAALESLESILKKFKKELYRTLSSELIMDMVFKILSGQAKCLKNYEEGIAHEQTQTEYDILLTEYAAGLMPTLANILPPDQYNRYFVMFLNVMFPKLKPERTEAERSFTAGVLAECCESMEENVKPFAAQLFQAFLSTAHDRDEEVRSNAIYGLGILMEHGKETLFDQYTNVLNLLSTILANETETKVKDNICAAVARMILTNISVIPIEQVFPVIIRNMPLKDDIAENATVLRCVLYLLNNLHPEVYSQLGKIFSICSKIISQKKYSDDAVQKQTSEVLKLIQKVYPDDFRMALASMPHELAEKIKIVIL